MTATSVYTLTYVPSSFAVITLSGDNEASGCQLGPSPVSASTPATLYTEPSAADTLMIVTDNEVTISINESKRLIAFLNIFFFLLNMIMLL